MRLRLLHIQSVAQQLLLGVLALGNLGLEGLVGAGEFAGALEHALLKLVVGLAKGFRGALLVIDVRAGTDPLDDLAVGPAQRDGPAEMPAVLTVTGAKEPRLDLVGEAIGQRAVPPLDKPEPVVRMKGGPPAL